VTFRVYNALSRTKEPFQSLEPGVVRMYNCGPTVYKRQHIGNFRSFVFADLLRRWLEYLGYEVRQVMNITDVGHILDDEEEGEDKIEAEARKTGRDPWKISREETEVFLADAAELGILEPMVRPKATEHIPEMIEMVKGLIDKGHAYRKGDNVYFDVTTFERYGRLSGNKVEDLDAGARVAVNAEKRNPADFALWKSDPRHIMKWDTEFGPDGFPGWHIECSAMARKHLGDRIDIHTGGEDNVFPHHECEIAQSECFTGQPFANYWLHTKFLQVDGGKMSKSLGNVYTIDDVKARGYTPRQLRYALLRGHYRQPLNFTWDILQEIATALEGLDDLVARLRRAAEGESGAADEPRAGMEFVQAAQAEFEAGMNEDLNVPRALAALFGLRRHALEGHFGRESATAALEFLGRANGVLGILDLEKRTLDAAVEALIAERQAARAAKDFAKSDELRDRLAAMGVELQDSADGVTWRLK